MSRQGLRSTRNEEKILEEESNIDSPEIDELDITLTEMPREKEATSSIRQRGQEMDVGQSSLGTTETITRKLEELEKRMKRLIDEEKKRREKTEADKERNLQKKLVMMETGVNRSLEITTEITRTLEERNNRMDAQFSRLEAQQTRMMERLNTEGPRREDLLTANRASNIKYVLPEFGGDTSPIRYMNQLKQYWEAVEPKDRDTHYLIERSLTGPPGDWWQIVKEDVSNFQMFLSKFSRRYWNEQAQHELRRRLEFGCHQSGKTISRAEYAIRLYAEAKELRPSLSSIEIIQKLARHFNEEIKHAIIGRGISHIEQLIELLENFDKIGPSNASRGENREARQGGFEERNSFRQAGNSAQQPSWRAQPNGSHQDRVGQSRHSTSTAWHNNGYNNTANRPGSSLEQSRNADTTTRNRQTDNAQWKHHQQSNYRVRNLEIEEEQQRENGGEGETSQQESRVYQKIS